MTETQARQPLTPTETQHRVRLWLIKQGFFLLLLLALLFVSAGTFNWPLGWLQMGLYVFIVAVQAVILIPRQPDLIAERSGYQRGSKGWDLAIAGVAAAVAPIATWIVAGLDFRNGWTAPTFAPGVITAAVVVWLAGYLLVVWAMLANRFFGATVRIQHDRGHHVMTSGPYRMVRHPGYVGASLFQLATPFMLASWWALIPTVIGVAAYIVRTAMEDRTLQAELDGYAAYADQVRYRLLPGVW